MANKNHFEALISEELTAEDQATIAGGMSFTVGTMVTNNGSFIDNTYGDDMTTSVGITISEINNFGTGTPTPTPTPTPVAS